MSQAENKVKWCLKKEKKEGRKHRGLNKTEPDTEIAKKHIKKSEHNLRAISYFKKGGYPDWSISAAFYTIYHCFLAILRKHGYESRNQECTTAAIKMLREKKKIKLNPKFTEELEKIEETHETNIITQREAYQYGIKTELDDENKIEELKDICKEAISETKDITYA